MKKIVIFVSCLLSLVSPSIIFAQYPAPRFIGGIIGNLFLQNSQRQAQAPAKPAVDLSEPLAQPENIPSNKSVSPDSKKGPTLIDYQDPQNLLLFFRMYSIMRTAVFETKKDVSKGIISAPMGGVSNPVRDTGEPPVYVTGRINLNPLGSVVIANSESERYFGITQKDFLKILKGGRKLEIDTDASQIKYVRGQLWQINDYSVGLKLDVNKDGTSDNFLIEFIANEEIEDYKVKFWIENENGTGWKEVTAKQFRDEIIKYNRSLFRPRRIRPATPIEPLSPSPSDRFQIPKVEEGE